MSLALPLPEKRNFSKPMIWPEARMHSLVFASRHVLACMLNLCGVTNFYAMVAVNELTLYLAQVVSDRLGDKEKRTTNAMPYPANVPETEVAGTKLTYASSQFLASGMCLTGDPTFAFLPLLAIQIAMLMMTLVRKGKATAGAYHGIYAWALWANLLGVVAAMVLRPDAVLKPLMLAMLAWRGAIFLRWKAGIGKYTAWIVAPLVALGVVRGMEAASPSLAGLPPCARSTFIMMHLAAAAAAFVARSPTVMLGPKMVGAPRASFQTVVGFFARHTFYLAQLILVLGAALKAMHCLGYEEAAADLAQAAVSRAPVAPEGIMNATSANAGMEGILNTASSAYKLALNLGAHCGRS